MSKFLKPMDKLAQAKGNSCLTAGFLTESEDPINAEKHRKLAERMRICADIVHISPDGRFILGRGCKIRHCQVCEWRASRRLMAQVEVKNKREIEFEFPVHLARMHDRHITKFRPLLPGSGSNWLFPSVDGGERPYKSLAGQISRVVLRYTGLTITPHQFRHFAGMMFLDEHPTGHGTVRDVLGHASIDTTTQYYTGIDQVKAGRIYDKAILALRERTKFAAKKEKKS
jgi:integrase